MLELGEIPLSMDDKWFLYCQGNVFHLHMSWDGLEIFQGNIIKSIQKDDLWLISAVRTSLDWSCQNRDRKQFITNFLQSVIRNHLNLYQ